MITTRKCGFSKKILGVFIAGAIGVCVDAHSMALEEVVVTATKREANIQDVPIAITAVTGKDLESRGASSLAEVGSLSPNVQLDQGAFLAGSSQVLTGYIRGIGQNDIASSLEPGVGVYVDGVFLARSTGANVDLLDVERVEVLKGPQGTLFGRNTIGGAINVVTRRPGEQIGGKLKVTAGERHLVDVKGTVDLPVTDSLFSQFSFSRVEQDGYQKIIPFPGDPGTSDEALLAATDEAKSFGSSHTRGGFDNYSVRGKLLWVPSDATEVTLALDYAKADEESGAFTLVDTSQDTNPGSYAAAYNACLALDPAVLAAIGLGPLCGPRTYAGGTLPGLAGQPPGSRLLVADGLYNTGDKDKTYGNGGNSSEVEISGAALTLDHTLTDDVSVKSITAFRKIESSIFNDLDGTPIALASTIFNLDQRQFSQEFQLNADLLDGDLNTVSGLYYFREDTTNQESAIIAEGLGNFFGPYSADTESYAAFFNSNYQLTQELSFTLGVRYTKDKKSYVVGQRDWNQSLIKLGIPAALYPDQNDLTRIAAPGETVNDYENVSFRVGTEYKLTQDVLTYISYAEGFKSGGISTRLSLPTPGNEPATFSPELANTWEAGLKSSLFDYRMQLNLAVFQTDYDDMQVTVIRGISPFFENAGKARIRGAELESVLQATDSVRLSAGVGYLDAAYRELNSSVTAFSKSDELVNTPEWSGNLAMDWDIVAILNGMLRFHVDYLYKSEMARDAANTPFIKTDDYELVNANFSWTTLDDAVSLAVWAKNLTDERYIVSASHVQAVGASSASYNPPRQYGVTVSYGF